MYFDSLYINVTQLFISFNFHSNFESIVVMLPILKIIKLGHGVVTELRCPGVQRQLDPSTMFLFHQDAFEVRDKLHS